MSNSSLCPHNAKNASLYPHDNYSCGVTLRSKSMSGATWHEDKEQVAPEAS
jgi:hypothetical protein